MQFFRLNATAGVEGAGVVSAEVNYLTVAPLGVAAPSLPGSKWAGSGAGSSIPLKGMVDGSDRILITRDGAFWDTPIGVGRRER